MPTPYVPPLHVHLLCRSGDGTPARQAANALHELLQGDALLNAVSPVDIPTFRVPVTPRGPGGIPWADASRHAVIVFVDDAMYAEAEVWGPWLGALAADADRHGGLVLGVTEDAGSVGNLSPALAQKQMVRVVKAVPDGLDLGRAWATEVSLRVFRALATRLAAPGEGLGRLFLSHAKSDGGWLAEALRDELARFAGDLAFFDAVSLREGESFEEGLLGGFDGAVVVALVTDAWAGRYWCMWEVAAGKERQCPFLAVDLLTDGNVRSPRYAGNARTMRWPLPVPEPTDRSTWAPRAGGQSREDVERRQLMLRIVGAALVELVRARHDRARLAAARDAGMLPADVTPLAGPPEAATLPPYEDGRVWRIVHPDPALPVAERELLRRLRPDVTVASLTEALAGRLIGVWPRPLRVALSISDPPAADLEARGLTPSHLFHMWTRLSLQLLLAGAKIGYGGDLRKAGYAEQLGDLLMSLAGVQRGPAAGCVHEYLGWPTWVGVDAATWKRYPRPAVEMHKLQAPDGVVGAANPRSDWTDAEGQLAWAVSMRAMRERMARYHDARVILGGQYRAGVSPVPGLVDELTTFLDLQRPVYILGGFGGMATVLGRALVGEQPDELTLGFQDDGGKRTVVREAIDRAAATRTFSDGGETRLGGVVDGGRPIGMAPTDFPAIVARLNREGLAALGNGLDDEQNRRLLRTRDPVEAISLVLQGLATVEPRAEGEA